MSTLAERGLWHDAWMRAEPATVQGAEADDMYMWLFWFCAFWFVLLMILMGYFVFKYRRKPGQIAPKSSSHNTPLEIAWTVIPSLFLVYIFFRGFFAYMDQVVAPGEALQVQLKAAKWNWTMVYPNGAETTTETADPLGFRRVPVFYMPADVPIQLRMNSQDVMHSFWVPDFRVKQDVQPNRYTTLWFQAQGPSGEKVHSFPADTKDELQVALNGVPYEDHWVFCAEYCGTEHSEMAAIIRVVPEDAFNRWLPLALNDPDAKPEDIGARVFKTKCSACHSDDGGVNTGPTWKDLFGSTRAFTDGTTAVADENYIRESILVPSAHIVQGFSNQMTPFQGLLNDRQIDGIIAYMKSKSVHAPKQAEPGAQPTDVPAPAPAPTPAEPAGTPAPH